MSTMRPPYFPELDALVRQTEAYVKDYALAARRDLLGLGISGHASFYGLWLLLPVNSFANSVSYEAMAELLPEWAWGVLFLTAGGVMLTGVLKRRRVWQEQGVFALCVLWAIVFGSMAAVNWASTGIPTYFMLSLICGADYISLKSRRNE